MSVVMTPATSPQAPLMLDPPRSPVDLNAVGKLFALMGQIAALEPITCMPNDATAVVIRDGAHVRVTADQALAIAEELMDEKCQQFADLDWPSRRMVKECVDTVWRLNAPPPWPYTGKWEAPVSQHEFAMAAMRRLYRMA